MDIENIKYLLSRRVGGDNSLEEDCLAAICQLQDHLRAAGEDVKMLTQRLSESAEHVHKVESERDTLQVRVGEMAAEVERLNGLLSTDDLVQVQQVAFNNYVESVGGEDSNAWHDKECDLIFYAGFDAGVKYLKEGKPCPHQ